MASTADGTAVLSFTTIAREAVTGTMPSLREATDRRPWLRFLDSCLRGIGQGGLVDNPVGGLFFLAAIATFSPWVGVAAAVGVLAATATAEFFGLERALIGAGLYGYNGALVATGLVTFLGPQWNLAVLGYVVVGAALTTLVMAALVVTLLKTWNVRPTALPFNIVLTFLLIALLHSSRGHAGPLVSAKNVGAVDHVNTVLRAAPEGPGANSLANVYEAVLHGIGQLFFLDSNLGGYLILAGLVICSRRIAVLAVLGSATAVLTSMALGMDGFRVYLGVPGVSGFLTWAALGSVFLRPSIRSYLIGVAAAAASAVFLAALTPVVTAWAPPAAFSLPYCLVTILVLFASGSRRTASTPLAQAA